MNRVDVGYRTEGARRGAYLEGMHTASDPSPSLDLRLSVHAGSGDTYECSKVLLARARGNGKLELLTAEWGRLLGYEAGELEERTLSQLLGCSERAAQPIVAALLDEHNMEPVKLTLQCRHGGGRDFRLHRHLDVAAHELYVVAEEIARDYGVRRRPLMRSSTAHTDAVSSLPKPWAMAAL